MSLPSFNYHQINQNTLPNGQRHIGSSLKSIIINIIACAFTMSKNRLRRRPRSNSRYPAPEINHASASNTNDRYNQGFQPQSTVPPQQTTTAWNKLPTLYPNNTYYSSSVAPPLSRSRTPQARRPRTPDDEPAIESQTWAQKQSEDTRLKVQREINEAKHSFSPSNSARRAATPGPSEIPEKKRHSSPNRSRHKRGRSSARGRHSVKGKRWI